MYIYTVYTYHNYTRINTILVYSNFFSAYHSYLSLNQWILKLYEKRITEYFSLLYDFTFEHKSGDTGLLRPHSDIVDFYRCPAILYYNIYNIHSVNLHKISRIFLCNIQTCNLVINYYNNKREEDIKKWKLSGIVVKKETCICKKN